MQKRTTEITVGDYVELNDGSTARVLLVGPKSETDDTICYGIDRKQSFSKHCKFNNKADFQSIVRDGGILCNNKIPYFDGDRITLDEIKQLYREPQITTDDHKQIDKYCEYQSYEQRFIRNYFINLPRIYVGDTVMFPYKNWCKGKIKYIGPYSKYRTSSFDGPQKYGPNGGTEIYFGVELFQIYDNDPTIHTIPVKYDRRDRKRKTIFYFNYKKNAVFCKPGSFKICTNDISNGDSDSIRLKYYQFKKFLQLFANIFFECITMIDYYNLIQCNNIMTFNEWNNNVFSQQLRLKKYIEGSNERYKLFGLHFENNERRVSSIFGVIKIQIKCADEFAMKDYKLRRNNILKSIVMKLCYKFHEKLPELTELIWSFSDAKEYLALLKHENDTQYSYTPKQEVPENDFDYYDFRQDCKVLECVSDEFKFDDICSNNFGKYNAYNGVQFSIFDELRNILILPKVIEMEKWFIAKFEEEEVSCQMGYDICLGLLDVSDISGNVVEETFVMYSMLSSLWES